MPPCMDAGQRPQISTASIVKSKPTRERSSLCRGAWGHVLHGTRHHHQPGSSGYTAPSPAPPRRPMPPPTPEQRAEYSLVKAVHKARLFRISEHHRSAKRVNMAV